MQPRNDEWNCVEPSTLESLPGENAASSKEHGERVRSDEDARPFDDDTGVTCPAGEVPTAGEHLPLREKLVLGFDALRRMLKFIGDLRKVDAVPGSRKPPVRPA